MEDNQPESRNNLPLLGRPRTRISGEKRYRIELGVGSDAKEALDRWRLFVDSWDCASPAELLQRAMDSLLIQTSHAHQTCDCRNSTHSKPPTIDVGCQYHRLDTVATPTISPKPSLPKLSLPSKLLSSSQSTSTSTSTAPATTALTRLANDHQKGVRKRARRRKKLIGVGTISENTKRMLLKHIPDSASERKTTELNPDPHVPDSIQLLSTTHSLTLTTSSSSASSGPLLAPPPTSHTSSSPSPSATSSSSLSGTIVTNSSNLLPSQSSSRSDLPAVKFNLPVGLTLQQPGLLSLTRPVFVPLQPPELESDLVRGCILPVSSADYSSSCSKIQDTSNAAITINPPSTLLKSELELPLSSETMEEVSEEDAHTLLEVDVGEPDSGGVSPAKSSLLRGRKGRPANSAGGALGKGRQAHTIMSRKKKTKGLGGSISETTRRMLLEHTSSDRSLYNKSLSRNMDIQESEEAGLTHSDNTDSSASVQHSSLGYSGSGTISESTKRILLQFYS